MDSVITLSISTTFPHYSPRTVLATVPRPVRIIILNDARLLLDDLGPGAGARHRRTQEDVDDEHDEEQHSQCNAEPQQPGGAHAFRFAGLGGALKLPWLQDPDARGGRHVLLARRRLLEGGRLRTALQLGTGTFAQADPALKGRKACLFRLCSLCLCEQI